MCIKDWREGDPNGDQQENCAALKSKIMEWIDARCVANYPALCEKPGRNYCLQTLTWFHTQTRSSTMMYWQPIHGRPSISCKYALTRADNIADMEKTHVIIFI